MKYYVKNFLTQHRKTFHLTKFEGFVNKVKVLVIFEIIRDKRGKFHA